MNGALLKAIGVGVGVFAVMMLVFWLISDAIGEPFITLPERTPTAAATPVPETPVFLK